MASIDEATGVYTFNPVNDFQDLLDGNQREVSFEVTATDEHSQSITKKVIVTIDGRPLSIKEDSVEVTIDVLVGTDHENTGFITKAVSNTDKVTLIVNNDGTLVGTPTRNWFGKAYLQIEGYDNNTPFSLTKVLEVTPVNDSPSIELVPSNVAPHSEVLFVEGQGKLIQLLVDGKKQAEGDMRSAKLTTTGSLSQFAKDGTTKLLFESVESALGDNGLGLFEMSNGIWKFTLDQETILDLVPTLDVGSTLVETYTFTANANSGSPLYQKVAVAIGSSWGEESWVEISKAINVTDIEMDNRDYLNGIELGVTIDDPGSNNQNSYRFNSDAIYYIEDGKSVKRVFDDVKIATFNATGTSFNLLLEKTSPSVGLLKEDDLTALVSRIQYRNLSDDPSSEISLSWRLFDGNEGIGDQGATIDADNDPATGLSERVKQSINLEGINDRPELIATHFSLEEPLTYEEKSIRWAFPFGIKSITPVEEAQTILSMNLAIEGAVDFDVSGASQELIGIGNSQISLASIIAGDEDTLMQSAKTDAVYDDSKLNGKILLDLTSGKSFFFTTTSKAVGLAVNNDGTFSLDTSSYGELLNSEPLEIVVPITVRDEKGATAYISLSIMIVTNDIYTVAKTQIGAHVAIALSHNRDGWTGTEAKALLNSVRYRNLSEMPTDGIRTFEIYKLKDNGGTASMVDVYGTTHKGEDTVDLKFTSHVVVHSINDAPDVLGVPYAVEKRTYSAELYETVNLVSKAVTISDKEMELLTSGYQGMEIIAENASSTRTGDFFFLDLPATWKVDENQKLWNGTELIAEINRSVGKLSVSILSTEKIIAEEIFQMIRYKAIDPTAIGLGELVIKVNDGNSIVNGNWEQGRQGEKYFTTRFWIDIKPVNIPLIQNHQSRLVSKFEIKDQSYFDSPLQISADKKVQDTKISNDFDFFTSELSVQEAELATKNDYQSASVRVKQIETINGLTTVEIEDFKPGRIYSLDNRFALLNITVDPILGTIEFEADNLLGIRSIPIIIHGLDGTTEIMEIQIEKSQTVEKLSKSEMSNHNDIAKLIDLFSELDADQQDSKVFAERVFGDIIDLDSVLHP